MRLMRDSGLVLAAVGLVALYVVVGGGGFPLDDSWIHQVYARNLAENGEWAFVPGEPSGASTSPLYTVLLAVGYVLNINYELWAHVLGTAALATTAVLGARMVERPVWLGGVVGLALLLTWHLIWAAASGMETMLFAMWTLVLMFLVWRRPATVRDGVLFGALAALAMATRPEGVLLAGLAGVVMLLVHGWRAGLRWGTGAAVGFAVVITPYLLLNLELTGGLFPATADAKQAQHAPLLALPYTERFVDMLIPILVGGQVFLIPGLLFMTGRSIIQRDWKTLLPVLWALGLVALYAARLPASYQHGRYVIPALPGLVVVGVLGMYALFTATYWRRFEARWGEETAAMLGRVITRTVGLAAVLTFIYFGVLLGPTVYRQDVRIIEEEMVAQAQWIADNLPPGELLAVHDIGAVGYFAPRSILDIAGLVNEEVVPLIGDDAALWALMRERDARYLMAFPDQIPGRTTDDERLCLLHQTPGNATRQVGGPKMVIYRLAWDGNC